MNSTRPSLRRRLLAVAAAAVAAAVWPLAARTLDPPYLAEMPNVKRVVADTEGSDRADSLARRMAVLNQLQRVIDDMAGQRRFSRLTPDEKRIRDSYGEELGRIAQEIDATFGPPPKTIDVNAPPGPESLRTKWFSAQWQYERDQRLRRAVFAAYFSPEFLRSLGEAEAAADAIATGARDSQLRALRGEPGPGWQSLTTEQQVGVIATLMIIGLLALPMLYRESRPFGIVKGDPRQMRAGFGRYTLNWVTGVIENYQRSSSTRSETTLTEYGDGTSETSTTSWTTRHESFSIVGKEGKRDVLLANADLHLTNGHEITAVEATRKGDAFAHWVLVCDRTTGEFKGVGPRLHSMFKVRIWLMFPLIAMAGVLGASTGILAWGRLGLANETFRGAMGMFFGWAILLVVFALVARRRARRFAKRDGPRILAAAKAEEAGLTAPAG